MTKAQTKLVKALFLDYDGTISPINPSESNSNVLHQNETVLQAISQKIPIAIITTKDLPFIIKRTPFAHAWAGIAGLETKTRNALENRMDVKKAAPHIEAALKYASALAGEGLNIEKKRFTNGDIIAFSVDWRQADNQNSALKKASRILTYCETLPLVTVKYEKHPFLDVFPCHVDKGQALLTLKEKLELPDGILYMGDSDLDNSAFKKADVAVGVIHGENPPNLQCDFYVKFEDVPNFLRHLLQNDFRINSHSENKHRLKF